MKKIKAEEYMNWDKTITKNELSPLEALERIKEFYPQWRLSNRKDFNLIETALKKLDKIESIPNNEFSNFQKMLGRRKLIYESQTNIHPTNIGKSLKALEVIKEYKLITYQECFNAICTKGYVHDLPQDVVDLLKEVLL